MGKPDQKMTIDRINNNGNYKPSNCRWTTQKVQMNNSRINRILTFKGNSKTVTEWAEQLNINVHTLFTRIRRGWTVERILTKKTNA